MYLNLERFQVKDVENETKGQRVVENKIVRIELIIITTTKEIKTFNIRGIVLVLFI